ncbi:hypothetical protein COS52_03305 [Candidatus Roizmanbacteria bacterium CG03_land_8_20_14_0_80_39_12]|uniref:Small-conductance mechanosensitive ion channel n=2 Tax=Candidatus Roizmaniibacteriota TaxID=1752723 RepID=A0A2M7BS60_9BACT|nr:MAG: hypothetical protein COS52_03305 [Candidatus Roizmanbacteria bacterium CG03_land_8_20_14_0_80_39_12]
MFDSTNFILVRFWSKFINYLPDFFGGLLIVLTGYFVATILKKLLLTILAFSRIDSILNKTKLITQREVRLWEGVLAELVKWTIIILFLIPTLETWGLSKATEVLNQFLFYIPNVIVAVIIGFVGIVISNLAADLVRQSVKSAGDSASGSLAVFTRSTIMFFTILIMLNQLGVAQDLIRIFFTGLVAMLAIAGGLAFGLGGKEYAKEILDELKKKLAK